MEDRWNKIRKSWWKTDKMKVRMSFVWKTDKIKIGKSFIWKKDKLKIKSLLYAIQIKWK